MEKLTTFLINAGENIMASAQITDTNQLTPTFLLLVLVLGFLIYFLYRLREKDRNHSKKPITTSVEIEPEIGLPFQTIFKENLTEFCDGNFIRLDAHISIKKDNHTAEDVLSFKKFLLHEADQYSLKGWFVYLPVLDAGEGVSTYHFILSREAVPELENFRVIEEDYPLYL